MNHQTAIDRLVQERARSASSFGAKPVFAEDRRVVSELLRPRADPTRLRVGEPNDAHEREADRIAEQVMRMPNASLAPTVRRKCSACEEEERGTIQREGGTDATLPAGVAAKIDGLRSCGGQPLPEDVRGFFEPRFGADFSGVRVHTDGRAEQAASDLGARAFTIGRDVAFAPAAYQPHTTAGRRLLAHELTHVVQQGAGRMKSTIQRACGPTDIGKPSGCTFNGETGSSSERIMPPVTPGSRPTPTPTCSLPYLVGSNRGCGSGTDFGHFDYPPNVTTPMSDAKLAAWATIHHPLHLPIRSGVSDLACAAEMDAVLTILGGAAGHTAFLRFLAGTGGTETHGPGSTLATLALAAGSFSTTLRTVQTAIEAQLGAQAPSGVLDPCALHVTPPATHFGFSDGATLKAVIGGTQGEQLFVTSFTGDAALRTYTLSLEFVICDDFGVDESDLYSPGLFGFWVLQHERSASHYKPFINQLKLPVTISGTF